jgi:hypothetical protein
MMPENYRSQTVGSLIAAGARVIVRKVESLAGCTGSIKKATILDVTENPLSQNIVRGAFPDRNTYEQVGGQLSSQTKVQSSMLVRKILQYLCC